MSASELTLYSAVYMGGLAAALISFFVLLRIPAPYGRHARGGWGPGISARIGWSIMEVPSLLALLGFLLWGTGLRFSPALLLCAPWVVHYVYRSCVYPFRIRTGGKTNPLSIVAMAVFFNLCNGYLNGRYLGTQSDVYAWNWFQTPQFVLGFSLWIAGWALNFWSDEILMRLRRNSTGGYSIPRGGFYRWVSCPNYLGEMVEWTGWAVMVWNPAGLWFAVWTAANLLPRALTHHRWYRQQFEDYPPQRRAVIPFLI